MKNTNKFRIVSLLFVMVFAIFIGMLGFANETKAEIVYSDSFGGGMRNVTYEYDPVVPNPRPSIYSLNPNPIKVGSGAVTVTVVGDNFVPGAVVKVNNFDRSTSYSSKTRLTVELLATDTARVGDKIVTVYNPGPGGGLSNSVVLSIVSGATSTSTGSVAGASKSTVKKAAPKGEVKGVEDCIPQEEVSDEEDTSDLAAGAIFGGGGFFPGSLVGWLILAILILLLVIMIRRMMGLEEKYHDSPLKHA